MSLSWFLAGVGLWAVYLGIIHWFFLTAPLRRERRRAAFQSRMRRVLR